MAAGIGVVIALRMTKPTKVVLTTGFLYLVAIAMLFVIGRDGTAALFLTFPASFPIMYLIDFVPHHSALETIVDSWTGNLVVLLVSAGLNVAGLYMVVRLRSKT
jgi:hypothetical protein